MSAGSVYFMRPERARGPVKIGFSKNPHKRLNSISASSPIKLQLAAIADGTFRDERRLHHRFADSRLHGEWFDYTDEIEQVISFVNENGALPVWEVDLCTDDIYVADVVVVRKGLLIYEARADLGLTQAQLGEKLGLDGSMISKMESGVLPIGPRTELAIEALLARKERGDMAA